MVYTVGGGGGGGDCIKLSDRLTVIILKHELDEYCVL